MPAYVAWGAEDQAALIWIFASVADTVKMGFLDKGAFSVRGLSPQTGNRKGVLDLFLFKKSVRDFLVHTWMASRNFDAQVKQKIMEHTSTHRSYRQHVRGYPDDGQTSLMWKKGWPQSAELFLQLVEAVAFDTEYDASLKNGVKNRKACTEMLEYVQMKERIAEIEEALSKEVNPAPGDPTSAATGVVEGQTSGAASAADVQADGQADEDSKEAEEKEIFERHWHAYAERLVSSHVTLISEPQTEAQLVTALSSCDVLKTKGCRGTDYVGALWVTGLSSESISHPHNRGAPFKKERPLKCGKAFLKARYLMAHKGDSEGTTAESLGPADCFLAMDNQKLGIVPKLTEFLKTGSGDNKKPIEKKMFTCVYTFDSMVARKQRVKGVATINQTETLLVATTTPLLLPQKDHKHYQGQNTGSVVTPIVLEPFERCWALTFAEKKQLYGKQRLPVGGKGGGDDEDDDAVGDDDDDVPPTVPGDDCTNEEVTATGDNQKRVRGASNLEPVSYHSLPVQFFDDICDAMCLKDRMLPCVLMPSYDALSCEG